MRITAAPWVLQVPLLDFALSQGLRFVLYNIAAQLSWHYAWQDFAPAELYTSALQLVAAVLRFELVMPVVAAVLWFALPEPVVVAVLWFALPEPAVAVVLLFARREPEVSRTV